MKSVIQSSNWTAVFLGLVLGFTFWANDQVFKAARIIDGVSESVLIGRSPASDLLSSVRSGTLAAERKLASIIAEPQKLGHQERHLASIGRAADSLDEFRFGTLQGKYAITLQDKEKISHISFVDTPGSEGRPMSIEDRMAFLKSNAKILDLTGDIRRISVTEVRGHMIETYQAETNDSQKPVVIRIEIDDQDRLFSVHLHTKQGHSLFKL